MPSFYLGRERELENELLANKAEYLYPRNIIAGKYACGIQDEVFEYLSRGFKPYIYLDLRFIYRKQMFFLFTVKPSSYTPQELKRATDYCFLHYSL